MKIKDYIKDKIDNGKKVMEIRKLKKNIDTLDVGEAKQDIIDKYEDMSLMIINFDKVIFPLIKELYARVFYLEGKDSTRLGGEKVYKEREYEKIEEIEEWFSELKQRWSKN